MKISIFGLGYVGAVSAACLSNDGHVVIGVDIGVAKVKLVNSGESPIIERGVGRLIKSAVKNKQLRAISNAQEAVRESEISFVCVGTPSQGNGSLDLTFVKRVCVDIGTALAEKEDFHTVVVRSTMLPGSMNKVVIPLLEQFSGRVAGVDFGLCFNPEFLREGSALSDYYDPPKTIVGALDEKSGAILASLYAQVAGPFVRTSISCAEMVKYTDNVWHALKIGFANEVGNICEALGIDGQDVMDIFCQDTKLNLSRCYLKPGFAFGGSCLPKDVRALTYKAKTLDLELPILNAIMPSNDFQIKRGVNAVVEKGSRKVGVLGFSFKAGTDDLRESPVVEMIERLLGKGYDIRVYDHNVNIARLIGTNRDYILNHIPHIEQLMKDSLDEVLDHAGTVVIGNSNAEFREISARLRDDQVLVDLVGMGRNEQN